jgi:UDP-N-acetylglucosamine 2-epimerase (non-hydrolysing)
MEAGNRSFDQRVPEETNRVIVDHVSDVNLPYTEHARRYLLAEGLPPDRVIKTGSPMKEVLGHQADRIAASSVFDQLEVAPGQYFVASIHREENVDDPSRLSLLADALDRVAERFDLPVVVSTHPRTRDRLAAGGIEFGPMVRSIAPLGFPDYVALQQRSRCTISDSGTITEESALVGFPAITIREAHERPEGMDEGVLVMSGLDADSVVASVDLAVRQFDEVGPTRVPSDYLVDDVSWRVTKIIRSYTDYVNRLVWQRR